ncbi:uncharacterized protein RCC_02199 [Ramularia collo-cygni]|uniref:Oxidoreductase-like domain-containing protein n=1 Tax=Ramularia collo-cygni TaxID=112498 RepID=A0A2D3UYT1_9PEZI|nr:uncharacterized protein RCC_02199 [Ramularia collo-cygni]CZT16356.1 uncharacterized protein RCC_02199 [Ramularia collo-cygni]
MRYALRALRGTATSPSAVYSPCAKLQVRHIAATWPRQRSNDDQVRPIQLQGYYADALDAPLRSLRQNDKPPADPSPEDSIPLTEKEKTLAKARVVFGDRNTAAEERRQQMESKSQLIAGILVPPKPEEPDNCCMSGCVNCVWELFREDLEEYAAKSKEAKQKMIELRNKGQATGMMAQEAGMPAHAAISMDDDGGGSETNWTSALPVQTAPSADADVDLDPLAGIPIGIREFMKTEKRLKQKHRDAGEYIETALDKDLRASVWGSGT